MFYTSSLLRIIVIKADVLSRIHAFLPSEMPFFKSELFLRVTWANIISLRHLPPSYDLPKVHNFSYTIRNC